MIQETVYIINDQKYKFKLTVNLCMNSLIDIYRGEYIKYFYFFLLIFQGLAIFLMNLFQTETYLFSDNALAIRHGIEIWRKGIFLENFKKWRFSVKKNV